MATTQRKPPKTWSLLGDVRRRPSAYEATAAKFNYHFRREPAPFEMDPQAPFNLFYLKHREGSAFNVDDWEGFRDPAKLTYADYVMLQHDRETYVDLLTDHHEAAESVAALDPAWVATLRELFVPLRFPLHVLQMTGLYVGQMAPSAFIINCSNFQAADELRRIQRIAYHTRALADAHGDDLAETATARGPVGDGRGLAAAARGARAAAHRARLGRGVRRARRRGQAGPGCRGQPAAVRAGLAQRRRVPQPADGRVPARRPAQPGLDHGPAAVCRGARPRDDRRRARLARDLAAAGPRGGRRAGAAVRVGPDPARPRRWWSPRPTTPCAPWRRPPASEGRRERVMVEGTRHRRAPGEHRRQRH